MERIEADLQRFANSWNNHKISTNSRAVHTPTHNLTPNQLEIQFRNQQAPENLDEQWLLSNYGIEGILYNNNDNNNPQLLNDVPSVELSPHQCPLTETQMIYFQEHINKLTLNDGFESFSGCIINAMNCFDYIILNII